MTVAVVAVIIFEYNQSVLFINSQHLSKHNELGKKGEQLALHFLETKGHVILETNYRFEHKEIDVISTHDDILVFTEIKSRSSYDFGYPEEAVSLRKQNFLKLAAEFYCFQHPQYLKIRFDVISLLIHHEQASEILHFEDAFY